MDYGIHSTSKGFLLTIGTFIKEFWVPFLAASSWTWYDVVSKDVNYDLINIIKSFGPAFFLASWATGQIIRIRRQTKVENNLGVLLHKSEAVLQVIASETDRMIANVSGGDGFCYVQFDHTQFDDGLSTLMLINPGELPMYNLNFRLCNIDEMKSGSPLPIEVMFHPSNVYQIDFLMPSNAVHLRTISIQSKTKVNYNIFYQARNGRHTQESRFRKVNGSWKEATRVTRDNKEGSNILRLKIDDGYPKKNGVVDWSDHD